MVTAGELAKRHGTRFDDVALSLSGPRREWFSRQESRLSLPCRIDNSSLYADTKHAAFYLFHIASELLTRLGHNASDLDVEYH